MCSMKHVLKKKKRLKKESCNPLSLFLVYVSLIPFVYKERQEEINKIAILLQSDKLILKAIYTRMQHYECL